MSNPTPPSTLDILGKKFKLVRIPDGEEEDCDGYMHLAEQRIGYREQPALEYNQDTVLHEITHAVDEILQAGMKERQVHLIAAGLLAVIKQNKEFAEWLLK